MSNWRVGGNSLFGGILPFIGWRTLAVDQCGEPLDPVEDDFDPDGDYLERSVFMISWFDWAFIFFTDGDDFDE